MRVFKRILLVGFLALFLAAQGWAGDKNLTFEWNQTQSDIQSGKFWGWKLYKSETPGTYDFTQSWEDIIFVSEQQVYQATKQLTSPDGEEHTYYFVLTALYKDGQGGPGLESGPSEEVNAVIDFEVPGVPFTLTVTVTTP